MKLLYGVSGNYPANKILTNGYTLFSWAMRMSSPPLFWGRNLTGENSLTEGEVNFLHNNYCAVALIYNELNETDVSKRNGVANGLCAVSAAKALGAPINKGIALFAEIKDNWSINHNWMIGYAYAILGKGYIPGFIANTDSSKNFNFGRQGSHYAEYMKDIAHISTAYWATEPKLEKEPTEWVPYCPSQLIPDNMDIWRVGKTIKYGDDISLTRNYIRDKSFNRFLWK